ncbi:MAG TPA: DNA-processing protein DprA [Candidatus Baltobacteraceae bacterium]|jgi:DNA processing protein
MPALLPRAVFEELRGGRALPGAFGFLWACGDLEGLRLPTVAIVGTRAATPYGRGLAHRFAAELGAAGCAILSGLALGIDAAAHEGALAAGAPTIGVLGGGHGHFFPRRNRQLAERMLASGGAVLSPFPPERNAFPSQFLERNGVVAALADALVVIEAPERSGALNTAGWAAGYIPVLAVPGDVDRAHVRGCHALIRDGATLARSSDDVLAEIGMRATEKLAAKRSGVGRRTDPLEREILRALAQGERTIDELAGATGESAGRLLAALGMLQLESLVERRDGARYAVAR